MKFSLPFLLLLLLFSCADSKHSEHDQLVTAQSDSVDMFGKMSGVSIEMPSQRMNNRMDEIVDFGGGWVALLPYGYTEKDESKVNYFWDGPWWGESLNGTGVFIKHAQEKGLKTLLKPHVWVVGQGWPGDFKLEKEDDWLIWESSYREYILACANLADSLSVDAFCIGTEYRKAVVERTEFWEKLIEEVRDIYDGPMTYAANWDNYEYVTFWDQLDFIGIDAYFPLSKEKEPSLEELKEGWKQKSVELEAFSKKWNKKICFTEYGFKSVDYMNGGSTVDEKELKPNMKNQEVGYTAFFNSVWKEEWMLGGFLWKWQFYKNPGGIENTRYTPQNKPAEKIIQRYYKAATMSK